LNVNAIFIKAISSAFLCGPFASGEKKPRAIRLNCSKIPVYITAGFYSRVDHIRRFTSKNTSVFTPEVYRIFDDLKFSLEEP
jgi:hypothetical protein